MKTAYGFSRRGPDRVAEELATVLSRKTAFEFKALFAIVHENLRARNMASGGEEMLRLRAYEKLQNLVQGGIVKKVGKTYRGIAPALVTFFATAAEMNAKFASGTHSRAPMSPPIPETPVAAPEPVKKAAAPKAAAPKAKAPAAKAPKAKAPAAKPASAKAKAPVAKAPAAPKKLPAKKTPVAAKSAAKKASPVKTPAKKAPKR